MRPFFNALHMKILLLGDASNYHATLAHALRLEGHDVTLASSGSGWMRTHRDIDISRKMANSVAQSCGHG